MVSTRPAREADFEFLLSLHRAAMAPHVAVAYGPWDEAWQRAHYRARFRPETIAIVREGGEDVGMVQVLRARDRLYLAAFEILPSHQGRGLGGAVLAELRAECDRARVPFELQVLKQNPARRLYERHGFVPIGETPTHVLMRRDPACQAADGSSAEGP